MEPIEIVCAKFAAQQDAIRSVRHTVFVFDQDALFALAFAEAECVGTARLLADGRIGRMAVLPEWRHRGVGSSLFAALLQRATEMGMTKVMLSAQVQVVQFYQQHEFVLCDEPYDQANIPHQNMYRIL